MKLIVLLFFLFIPTVFGQQISVERSLMCGDAIQAVAFLKEKYNEEPILRLIKNDGNAIILVFANQKTGTSTILEVNRDGMACEISSGTALQINTKILNNNYGTGV